MIGGCEIKLDTPGSDRSCASQPANLTTFVVTPVLAAHGMQHMTLDHATHEDTMCARTHARLKVPSPLQWTL